MILRNIRRIAADSNVLLSAAIGKAALKVFTETTVEVVTTEYNFLEVKKYLPHMAVKYRLDPMVLFFQLEMLPLIKVKRDYYKSKLLTAQKHLAARDPDDIHLAALALYEHIPIWSNDKDFSALPVLIYPTAILLKMLDL